MLKDEDLGARETGAVDDGGVVQLVGNDDRLCLITAEYRACIGGEPGLKDYAGFHILEASDLFFELHVDW